MGSKIKPILSRTLARAFGVPGWVYGTIYILCIPTFALVYSNMPNSFAHSNIAREAYARQIESEFLEALETTLRWHFKKNYENANPVILGKTFGLDEFRLGSPNFNGRIADVPLYITIGNVIEGYLPAPIYHLRLESDYVTDGLYAAEIVNTGIAAERYITPAELGGYFLPPPFDHVVLDPRSKEIFRELGDFSIGIDPGDDHTFLRMLYFSTVTITTLGFGDIVPVDDVARCIVALESILGLILIGFFLNSITSGQRRS